MRLDLADCHAKGKDALIKQDFASTWLAKADEQGIPCAEAQYMLARCYRKGIGVEQNHEMAFEWSNKAAEQDFPEAQLLLAICYKKGIGIEKSDELAEALNIKAFESEEQPLGSCHSKDITDSFVLLGDLYAHGNGVEQCDAFALMLYERAYHNAEENNNSEAGARLDKFFLEHKVDGMDYHENIERLRESVCDKNSAANIWLENHSLRLPFPELEGKDDAEQFYQYAFEWCEKELQQQPYNFEALLCAGILTLYGKGTQQNDGLAKKHFGTIEEVADEEFSNPQKVKAVSSLLNAIYFEAPIPPEHLDWACGDFENGISILNNGRIYEYEPFLPKLTLDIMLIRKEYDLAEKYLEESFGSSEEIYWGDKDAKEASLLRTLKNSFLSSVEKEKQLELKNKEINNLVAMFAHNFLGTLQCIRSNAEHDNNPTVHLKNVKRMTGALTAFSILSADDDKLVEQLKQDNSGEITLQQSLANNLALAISQLLGKTNKDKIVNLYLRHLKETQQIENNTSSKQLRENKDYRKKWQALQHQWEDEFNALFSETAGLIES